MPDGPNTFIPAVEDVINRILSESRRPLSEREIRRHLGAEMPRSELRRALRRLSAEGRVVARRGKRWAPAVAGTSTARATGRIRLLTSGAVLRDATDRQPLARIPTAHLRFALDGDLVEVEWIGRPVPTEEGSTLPQARVVRVLERRRERITGVLHRSAWHWFVIPDDGRAPWNVQVRERGGVPLRIGRQVVVQLDPWTPQRESLTGVVVEDLGPAARAETRRRALHRRHGLSDVRDEDTTREVAHAPRTLRAADLSDRVDLRADCVFTIDPADAHDFDDAVSLCSLGDKGWQLDVHIADVSHYVAPGSGMDRDARERGTTVYLVGEAITMLPPELTWEVCSLQPEHDRLCLTVRLWLTPDGDVCRDAWFPSVVRSRARLSYEEVQRVIVGGEDSVAGALAPVLRDMHRLAQRLRARRMAAGALDLATPEVRFERDADGEVIAIRRRGCEEAYHLIEEFMLLANSAVARRLSQAGVPALYRVHAPPEEEQWATMEADLKRLGLSLRDYNRAAINQTLVRVRGTPIEYPATLAVLRNLKRAVYSAHREEHFGLANPCYTHFTSPIRRYPDLVVHRQCKALAAGARPPYTPAQLRAIAEHCSRREYEADEAEADSVAEARVAFFADQLRKGKLGPYPAVVTDIRGRAVWVELVESLQRGKLKARWPARTRGRQASARPRVGETLWVELLQVDERRRWVDFCPSEASRPESGRRRDAEKRDQRWDANA